MAPCSSWSATPGIENLTRLRARGHSQRYMYLRNLPGGKVRAKLRSWASFPLLVFAVRHIQRPLRLADCRRRRVSTRPLFPANKQSSTRKHRSSQDDSAAQISQLSALFSIRYLLNPCFPDFTSKTLRISLILSEQREGGTAAFPHSAERTVRRMANHPAAYSLLLIAYC
jgi:hypothetical protein